MTAPPFILLDDSTPQGGPSWLFEDPREIVVCDAPEDVGRALARIQEGLDAGQHAAGFFSYELGYLLEPKLAPLLPEARDHPLVWIGLFDAPRRLSAGDVAALLGSDAPSEDVENLRLSMTRERYLQAFEAVQDYIAAGDVYQINLTLKYLFDFPGDPLALYRDLRRKQAVAYGAVLRTGEFDILSLSPELFFEVSSGKIRCRPMKGTAPRGLTVDDDRRLVEWLGADEKSRAENLMIVDLLRNDVSRVAEMGSVRVDDLFHVETYRTVHQMTSQISADLGTGTTLDALLAALFPCGSVTGAPKIRAMEIIRELEADPRGVYTGTIGMMAPDGDARFNVAIRTLTLFGDGRGEMGIGSGVVADSSGASEFEECLLKAEFFTAPAPEFQLIETLRLEQDGSYYLLDRHLARLAASARHFGFVCDIDAVRLALEEEARVLTGATTMVRLLLSARGGLALTSKPVELPSDDTVWRYVVSDKHVDVDDVFFYHKTTRRAFYEDELARQAAETGCDEVVFLNAKGEVTEGARTNVFVERGGVLATPPVSSGLLAGTLRQELLETRPGEVVEAVLTLDDLAGADAVYLGNSVRGLVRAVPAESVAEASAVSQMNR